MTKISSDSPLEALVRIPGGDFQMGVESDVDRGPVHEVSLDPFYIEKYQVTNSQYFKFCEASGHRLPDFWEMQGFRCGLDYPNHPVIGVSWLDVSEYAAWHDRRLPTEAEWEYAARGNLEGMEFPHGKELNPTDGNYNRSGHGGPVEVGTYPPNGFGLHDMLGNVVEWVWDFYSPNYYSSSPSKNPQGPETGKFRVIRGGGWHSGPMCQKVYFRNALPPGWVDFNVGFRCVKDIEI